MDHPRIYAMINERGSGSRRRGFAARSMSLVAPSAETRSPLRCEILHGLAIIGSGTSAAGVIGLWRAAFVECTSLSNPLVYPSCPWGAEGVVLYLGIVTVALAVLATSVILGTFPRLASFSAAVLFVGAFLFPYELAFPDLAVVSPGYNPAFAAGALIALGAAAGFLEPIRLQETGQLRSWEPVSIVTVGGVLMAFTAGTAYWLPYMLSGATICHGPAGWAVPCAANAPLLPESFSLVLIALGVAAAAPLVYRPLAPVGFLCAIAVFAAAYVALVEGLFFVSVGLGLGSLFAIAGLVPRVFSLGTLLTAPTKDPRLPGPRRDP